MNKYRLLFYQRKPLLPLCCQWWCTTAVPVCAENPRSALRWFSVLLCFWVQTVVSPSAIHYNLLLTLQHFPQQQLSDVQGKPWSYVLAECFIRLWHFWSCFLSVLDPVADYFCCMRSYQPRLIWLLLESSLELSFSTELKTSNIIFCKCDKVKADLPLNVSNSTYI